MIHSKLAHTTNNIGCLYIYFITSIVSVSNITVRLRLILSLTFQTFWGFIEGDLYCCFFSLKFPDWNLIKRISQEQLSLQWGLDLFDMSPKPCIKACGFVVVSYYFSIIKLLTSGKKLFGKMTSRNANLLGA